MNLVIEQHPRTITSNFVYQQSNYVNNHYSTSPLRPNFKRQNINLQTNIHSNILMSNEENNSIASNQRLKRSIPTNSSRRPSSPAFNGKKQQQQQQSTKRSAIIDNNNNDLTSNIDENSTTKRFKQDDLNHSSTTKVDASVETISIGLATEPDQLGPCEPGTSVVLEGIVWNETDSGVLVVNVTWRGKTYVGTLLDSTKQDWACPRLTCDSPTSDYDPRNSSKTSRGKRYNNNNNNGRSSFQQFASNHSTATIIPSTITTSDDRKLRNNIKTRQSKRTNPNNFDENQANNSSPLTSPYPTNSTFFPNNTTTITNSETQLISCSESSCHKQFVSTTALNYHLSHAHKKTEPISTTISQTNTTRDEQDVAHILANVADYVRRPSPRSSPDHHQRQTTLTWPCPTISSNLVLSSSLNNNEQTIIPNSTRTNIELDEMKPTVKQADHFLLEIKDEPDDNKKTIKIPTPPPSSSSSASLVQINLTATIQPPPVSTSPAYSDISDEDPNTTLTNDNQQISPSTVNLLNDQTVLPNTSWPPSMLLQQFGSFIQHGLNSKTNSNSSHNTDDSTVKNILDSRRTSSTTQSSTPSSSSINDPLTLYHYHSNGIGNDAKISPTILNSLTSPNENLLNPSSSSTINPSR